MPALEVATIEVATSYAVANGYAPDDRTAVGLVLAGMAIAAVCGEGVRAQLLVDYFTAFPTALLTMQRWAERLESAVR